MRGDRTVVEARRRPCVAGMAASQPALVAGWLERLPVAMTPLWQLTQVPVTWV